jgi:hypothetical protein
MSPPGSGRRPGRRRWSAGRASRRQPQHGLHEVRAMRREHPGGAQDRMGPPAARTASSPASLRAAIGAERPGGRVGRQGASPEPSKDVVGRRYARRAAARRAGPRHGAGASPLTRMARRASSSRPVDGGIGGGVDHGGGRPARDRAAQAPGSVRSASRARPASHRSGPAPRAVRCATWPVLPKTSSACLLSPRAAAHAVARSCSARHQGSLSRYQSRCAQPLLQRHRGAPAQLVADARRVDGVAQVVAGPVGDEGDLVGMGAALGRARRGSRRSCARGRCCAPRSRRRCCRCARPPLFASTSQQRVGVILDIEPVAHVLARRRPGSACPRARSGSPPGSAFRESGRGRNCSSSWSAPPAGRRSRARRAPGGRTRPWRPNRASSGS